MFTKEAKSRAKDPVCGMTVDEATALHAERDGKTFCFCSDDCRQSFCPNPPLPSWRTSIEAAVDNRAPNKGVIPALANGVADCVIRTGVIVTGVPGTWSLFGVILLTLGSVLVSACAPGPSGGTAKEWEAPARAAGVQNPVATGQKPIALGKALYQQNCLACHGNSGHGNGSAAIALERHPSDLTVAMMWEHSDGALFWKITEGRRPMPSFDKLLTDDQRWQIVDYIRTLAVRPDSPTPIDQSKAMPAMGDMR